VNAIASAGREDEFANWVAAQSKQPRAFPEGPLPSALKTAQRLSHEGGWEQGPAEAAQNRILTGGGANWACRLVCPAADSHYEWRAAIMNDDQARMPALRNCSTLSLV
jgi:hypothetical protein